jgi:hypothetical protein
MILSEEIKSTFKDAAKKLTGSKKRDFTAKVIDRSKATGRMISFA